MQPDFPAAFVPFFLMCLIFLASSVVLFDVSIFFLPNLPQDNRNQPVMTLTGGHTWARPLYSYFFPDGRASSTILRRPNTLDVRILFFYLS